MRGLLKFFFSDRLREKVFGKYIHLCPFGVKAGDLTLWSRCCSYLPAGAVPGSGYSPPAARLAYTSRCTSPRLLCLRSHSSLPGEPESPGPQSPLLPNETRRQLEYFYLNNIFLKTGEKMI